MVLLLLSLGDLACRHVPCWAQRDSEHWTMVVTLRWQRSRQMLRQRWQMGSKACAQLAMCWAARCWQRAHLMPCLDCRDRVVGVLQERSALKVQRLLNRSLTSRIGLLLCSTD